MLHEYRVKSRDELYLDDIPHIRHPDAAFRDLADTARQNRIIKVWDLPLDYSRFVDPYRQYHYNHPWMAYRDALADIKSGKIVLLRQTTRGAEILGVQTSSGDLRSDLPLGLHSRLSYLISHEMTRPVTYSRPAEPVQHAQSAKTINSKAAGRLLAAGGIYNGNIDGFRKTAEQLGGDALTGYDQVLNETTKGTAIALVSIAAGLGLGRMGAAPEISQLAKLTKTEIVGGGAARAQRFSQNWPSGDLGAAVNKFAGDNPVITVTESGKQVFTHPKTGVQVVEDLTGSYFRIYDPSLPGKRKYLDLDGNIPNNKILETGKQVGRTQSEYNEVTHFNIR
ncbi:hypothetical protein ACTV70_004596 [Cronobacter dublinensis]